MKLQTKMRPGVSCVNSLKSATTVTHDTQSQKRLTAARMDLQAPSKMRTYYEHGHGLFFNILGALTEHMWLPIGNLRNKVFLP